MSGVLTKLTRVYTYREDLVCTCGGKMWNMDFAATACISSVTPMHNYSCMECGSKTTSPYFFPRIVHRDFEAANDDS